MIGNVLGRIMSPAQIDVEGIMDLRQQRLERDKQSRQKELLGKAVAQAMPDLEPGSTWHTLAQNDPEKFMLLSKALDIPTNQGQRLEQFRKDIGIMSQLGMSNPLQAMDYAQKTIEERKKMGINSTYLQDVLDQHANDPEPVWRAIGVLNEAFNPPKQEELMKVGKDDRVLDPNTRKVILDALPDSGGMAGRPQADVEKYQYYQSLGGKDTEAGREFGIANNFLSRQGRDMSTGMEKTMEDSLEAYTKSAANVNKYQNLISNIKSAKNMSGGLYSSVSEFYKENAGIQDEITDIRNSVRGVINSEVIAGLPPGSASNADIKIFSSSFPTDKANPEQLARWLESAARLQQKAVEYNKYKYDFIQKHSGLRGQKGENFIDGWKKLNEAQDRLKSLETPK
jgi:hypothetical protein